MRSISKAANMSFMDAVKPQLTSLVDVLTVLLIFLIRSFSAEASLVSPVSTVSLPVSSCDKVARMMTSIEITPDAVQVNGTHVASLSSVTGSGNPMQIGPLYEKLTKDNLLAAESEVMIQADKSIEFEIIKKVMFTCSKAGAKDYTVLVVNEE